MADQYNDDTQNLEQDLDNLKEQCDIKNDLSDENLLQANDELSNLTEENKLLKDQLLRLAADMENLRRRTSKDVKDAKLYSIAQFARDMLSVSDNLERALNALPQEARANDQAIDNLAQGVEMTQNAMLSSLERHGVKKITPKGEKFDPNFHQAMFEVVNDEVPVNTVQEVIQAGFVIGDRVLRPALVGVTKHTQTLDLTKEDALATQNEV